MLQYKNAEGKVTIEQCLNHIQTSMHASIVQWNSAIYISSANSNPFGKSNTQNKRVAINSSLVKTIPLVDIILRLHIDKPCVQENLQRLDRTLIDGCKKSPGDTL